MSEQNIPNLEQWLKLVWEKEQNNSAYKRRQTELSSCRKCYRACAETGGMPSPGHCGCSTCRHIEYHRDRPYRTVNWHCVKCDSTYPVSEYDLDSLNEHGVCENCQQGLTWHLHNS